MIAPLELTAPIACEDGRIKDRLDALHEREAEIEKQVRDLNARERRLQKRELAFETKEKMATSGKATIVNEDDIAGLLEDTLNEEVRGNSIALLADLTY